MAFNNYLEDENDKPYFTTNSLAYYYDKMEGFAKAVEGSAKALNLTKEEIEQRIALRLQEWDKNLEGFDGSVEKLLTEWVDDGTLTPLIDSTLIDKRLAPVTALLAEKANQKNLEQTKTEIAGIDQRVNNLVIPLSAENSNIQVTDSLVSVNKGRTFQTLSQRIEETEFEIFEGLSRTSINPPYVEGSYINSLGTVSTLAGWKYSAPIELKKHEKLIVKTKGTGTNVAIISESDSTGSTRKPIIVSTDSTVKRFVYTAKVDVFLVVSGSILAGVEITKLQNLKSETDDIQSVISSLSKGDHTTGVNPTFTEGAYHGSVAGHIATQTGWKYSAPILLKYFETLIVKTRGAAGTVAIITKTDINGGNRSPLVISPDGIIREYEYSSDKNVYVSVSGSIAAGIEISKKINTKETFNQLDNTLTEIKNSVTQPLHATDYSVLFKKALFAGDSLTRGFYAEYPQSERNRSFNYPVAIAQKTNWAISNMGISGATASSWLNTHQSTELSGYDVAFLCFGRNGGFQNNADVIAYETIIEKIKSESPNAIIFILSLPPSNTGSEISINEVVKTIATKTKNHYLNITDTGIMNQTNGSIYRPTDGVHFNKIGYAALALTILDNMNYYISSHPEDFVNLYVEG